MASERAPTRSLFPRLPGGPSGMAPEVVARHQRGRLEGAMVEAVARHGFAGVTLRELVSLAGISKSTFYEHFESKQDCFFSTFDEISRLTLERVSEAYRVGDSFREKQVSGLSTFMRMAAEEPAAASLAAVESLTLGTAGVAHRERASESFERMMRRSFEEGAGREVSALTVRAIASGIQGVMYRRLRAGRSEELPGVVETLVDWGTHYLQPDGEHVLRAAEASLRPSVERAAAEGDGEPVPGWGEPPDSRRSRRALSQRKRIVRAAARVVAERGYEALSIPAISAAAGVSNQTFYEHFHSKRDAFIAAFELLTAEVLDAAREAFEAEGDRVEAIGAGLRAMLDEIVRNELFARLAFFELPTAGPAALDRADAIMDAITSYLQPGIAPRELGGPLPRAVLEAISAGIWATIQHEIAHGRRIALPQLAPDIVRLSLAPFAPPPIASPKP